MLALVAASIVASHDRRWLARPLYDLAAGAGVRPERLSRIKARVLDALEGLIERASRRGRPKGAAADDAASRLAAAEALLAVASSLLHEHKVRGREIQDVLVAAQARLQREYGITHRRFCRALGLCERTFRWWGRRSRRPARPAPAQTTPPKAPPARRRHRGRFALEVTPAGVQAMADTSDWQLFGVPLKLIAVQDPGARALRLWEASEVATGEDAQKVVEVVRQALGDQPGTQLITDQGTPYLARAARAAYEQLELEHAPQKEGHPEGKATLERSFGIVKQALAPLAQLTEQLAQAVPALRHEGFAAAAGRLLAGTFLAVYLRARRAQLGPGTSLDPETFAALAERARENARAEDRSIKLTLERIHRQYDMEGSRTLFVRRFRRHHLTDVLEAERRMGNYACRCHARRCDRYFAAVLRRTAQEQGQLRAEQRRQTLRRAAHRREAEALKTQHARRHQHPEEWVAHGLQQVALQWRPERDAFLFHPHPPECGELQRAIERLLEVDPLAARDHAELAWSRWQAQRSDLGEKASRAIRAALNRTLALVLPSTPPSTPDLAASILGPHENRRPPPAPYLRI